MHRQGSLSHGEQDDPDDFVTSLTARALRALIARKLMFFHMGSNPARSQLCFGVGTPRGIEFRAIANRTERGTRSFAAETTA